MKKFSINVLVFLALIGLQTSFIASLPWPLNGMPILFVVTVYLVQHHGLLHAAWWLVGYGVWLDMFDLHLTRLDTIPYLCAAIAILVLLRRFFSNRSWYGILACGMTVLAVKDLVSITMIFTGSFFGEGAQLFITSWMLWEALFCIILLSLCFQFANRIRLILKSSA